MTIREKSELARAIEQLEQQEKKRAQMAQIAECIWMAFAALCVVGIFMFIYTLVAVLL